MTKITHDLRWTIKDGDWVQVPCFRHTHEDGRVAWTDELTPSERLTLAETRQLFETREFEETLGVVRLSAWPEGLVLWVSGCIAWRSWKSSPETLRLRELVKVLLDTDPDEIIADGGITVLDQWRKDAAHAVNP